MGLRELKMERTRQQIVDVAVELFITNGFDDTTMEEIAEGAEVGSRTLYRYFANKDLIIVEPFRDILDIGDALLRRPPLEPLSESLGAILVGLPGVASRDLDQIPALRRIIDTHPGPRARFWDLLAQSRQHFEIALADRMKSSSSAAQTNITAMVFIAILGMALDRWWGSDQSISREVIAEQVIAEVRAADLILPDLPVSGLTR